MRIVIFGATGMVGARLVTETTARGHEAVAVSRSAATDPAVETVAVDVLDRVQVERLLHTADVAISAVRPRPGEESGVPATTTALLDAAAATGTRLLLVGGAGPLASPTSPGTLVIDDEQYVAAAWRASAVASVAQLRACEGHPAAWTYVSPPAELQPGRRTGEFRRGTTTLLVDEAGRSRISAEDLAVALVDEAEEPGGEQHITVGY